MTKAAATTAISKAEASASTLVFPSLIANLARAPDSFASFRRVAARAKAGIPTSATRLSTTAAKAVFAIFNPSGVGTSVCFSGFVFVKEKRLEM